MYTHCRYGKMYLPPADAVIMNDDNLQTREYGNGVTYAQYRAMEKEVLALTSAIDNHQQQQQSQTYMRGSDISSTSSPLQDFHRPSLKYGDYPLDESKLKEYSELRDKILPVACGASMHSAGVFPSISSSAGVTGIAGSGSKMHSSGVACTSSGNAGIWCWMQCYTFASAGLSSCTAANAICVDTSANNITVPSNSTKMSNKIKPICSVTAPTAFPTASVSSTVKLSMNVNTTMTIAQTTKFQSAFRNATASALTLTPSAVTIESITAASNQKAFVWVTVVFTVTSTLGSAAVISALNSASTSAYISKAMNIACGNNNAMMKTFNNFITSTVSVRKQQQLYILGETINTCKYDIFVICYTDRICQQVHITHTHTQLTSIYSYIA